MKNIVKVENAKLGSGFMSVAGSNSVWNTPTILNDYRIYINDLDEIDDHLERIDLIRCGTPNDAIELIITTPGGLADLAMLYASAITESQAVIRTYAVGRVASAGTLIWAAAKNRSADKYSYFMFHNVQAGLYGDGQHLASGAAFMVPHYEIFLKDMYAGILDDGEITTILQGGQVYLSGTEVMKRISSSQVTDAGVSSDTVTGFRFKLELDDFKIDIPLEELSEQTFAPFNVEELRAIASRIGANVSPSLKRAEIIEAILVKVVILTSNTDKNTSTGV